MSEHVYAFVTYRHNWSEDRVYYQDEQEQLHSVPAQWTDVLPPDPFRVLAAGRAFFHPGQLQQLATLVARLKALPPPPPGRPNTAMDCLANKVANDNKITPHI